METIKLFIKSALIDNVVFIQYLAICPFIGMTNDTEKATGMGLATTFVIMLATAVTWPIYKLVMVPLGLEFLQTLFFILVIASLVQLVEFFLKKMSPSLYNAMGVYLALITTNCAVLGVAILVIQNQFTIAQGVAYAFSTAVGFGLALTIFAGIREQLAIVRVPKAMEGMPIALVTAGLLAIAFMGFSGVDGGLRTFFGF